MTAHDHIALLKLVHLLVAVASGLLLVFVVFMACSAVLKELAFWAFLATAMPCSTVGCVLAARGLGAPNDSRVAWHLRQVAKAVGATVGALIATGACLFLCPLY